MAAPALTDLRRRRDEILNVAHNRGARRVRVFGSVARGDAGPGSDIDFLVELEAGRSLLDLGGLLMDLRDSSAATSTLPPKQVYAPALPSAYLQTPSICEERQRPASRHGRDVRPTHRARH